MLWRYTYFRFWPPCHYFRLAVAAAITFQHFFGALRGHKPQIFCWNFDDIYHTFGDISTSDLGDHIPISGCLSSSKTLYLNSMSSTIARLQVGKQHIMSFFSSETSGSFFYPQGQRRAQNSKHNMRVNGYRYLCLVKHYSCTISLPYSRGSMLSCDSISVQMKFLVAFLQVWRLLSLFTIFAANKCGVYCV